MTRHPFRTSGACCVGLYGLLVATADPAVARSTTQPLPATGVDTAALAAVGMLLILGGATALRGSGGAQRGRADRDLEEETMNPDFIATRDFYVAVRGYDRDEVRSFLEEVAAYCRGLEGSASSAAQSGQVETSPYEAFGKHVASVLEAAERSADALVKDARDRAATIVAEARADAERTRRDDEQRLETLRRDLEARERELQRVLEEARQRAEELEREADAARADAAARAEQIVADAKRAAAESYRRRDETHAELSRLLERIRDEVRATETSPVIDLREEADGLQAGAEMRQD